MSALIHLLYGLSKRRLVVMKFKSLLSSISWAGLQCDTGDTCLGMVSCTVRVHGLSDECHTLVWFFFWGLVKVRPWAWKEEARSSLCDEAIPHDSHQVLKKMEAWHVKVLGGHSWVVVVRASICQPQSPPGVPRGPGIPNTVTPGSSRALLLCVFITLSVFPGI